MSRVKSQEINFHKFLKIFTRRHKKSTRPFFFQKKVHVPFFLLVVGFCVFGAGQVLAGPGAVEFTADVVLDLDGLGAVVLYIAANSAMDNLVISGTNASFNGIDSILLKAGEVPVVLSIPLTTGVLNISISSDHISSPGYLSQWIVDYITAEEEFTLGVAEDGVMYALKRNGIEIGEYFSVDNKITFKISETGTYTVEVKERPGVEFTADVILDLSGLGTTIYIAGDPADGSKADYLTISGNELNVYGVWYDNPFLLKTAAHKVLQLTPSGGTADFVFSSANVFEGFVEQWTATGTVGVAYVVGVSKANTDYTVEVKKDGVLVWDGSFNSGGGAEVSFNYTGSGEAEVFYIFEVPLVREGEIILRLRGHDIGISINSQGLIEIIKY